MKMKLHSMKRYLIIGFVLVLLTGALYGIYFYNRYMKVSDYEEAYVSGTVVSAMDFEPLTEDKASVKGMTLVAQNEKLKLYIDEKTTFVALYDRETGTTITSNPLDFSKDSIANKSNKDQVASQIEIEYYDENRSKKKMNNYGDAIESEQFVIESIEDGVRITYTIGNLEKGIESLPMFISPERLQEKVLDHIDEKMQKNVKKQFIETDTKPGFLEMRAQVANSKIVLNQIMEAFEAAGYSEEDLIIDNQEIGVATAVSRVTFTIPLDYQIVEDCLIARINTEQIEEAENGTLATIKLLDFFGAGGVEDEGYVLVPNGSGSLINFNNGKTKQDAYYQQVYGIDPLIKSNITTQSATPIRLPVYGSVINDHAFLAAIDRGQAIASITADISGKRNSYNHVGTLFTVRDYETLSMFGSEGSDAELPVVEARMYQGDLSLSFKILTGDEANYSGMANSYRVRLIKEGVLQRSEEITKTPFYLDVLGAFEKRSFVMGVPYYATHVMTDIEETKVMVDALADQGIDNIRTRYLGWFNDGYYHDVARSIDVIDKIGGDKALRELDTYMEEKGGGLYPDVAFMEVALTSDDYHSTFESARFIAGITVMDVDPDLATMLLRTNYREKVRQLVSPQAVISHVDGFVEDYQSIGIEGLSLRDLGDVLFSDKRRKRPIDRVWASDIVSEQIEKLKYVSTDMMITGGNSYALPYAEHIIDLPMGHNPFYIVDEAVPFNQMVLHGYVDYADSAYNVQNTYDLETAVLKMVEYGSSPHFVFTESPSSELKKTAMEDLYSTQYLDWIEDAKTMYEQVSYALDIVRGSSMVKHEALMANFYKITYDNDVVIYVNYTDEDMTVEDQLVLARNYTIRGGVNK